MSSVFVSYSTGDVRACDGVVEALGVSGVAVFRDRERLLAGDRWPARLGQAIEDCGVFLLLWSHQARASDLVELEWCTAVALKKQIVPLRIDDEPLPAMLRSVHWIDWRAVDAPGQLAARLQSFRDVKDAGNASQVIKRLGEIEARANTDVGKALAEVKRMVGRPLVRWQVAVVAVVAAAVGVAAVATWRQATQGHAEVGIASHADLALGELVEQTVAGFVSDGQGPVEHARVVIPELGEGAGAESGDKGFFRIKARGKREQLVRVFASAPGYESYNHDVTLGDGNFAVVLKKRVKP